MNNHLREMATKLRLSGLLSSLEIRLQEAMSHGLSHAEFLELVLQDELAVRDDRRLQRRVKAAMFRELKTLEGFNWAFNPMIKKKQIFELATGRFIRESRDVLWLGPPGVGKSHLCQAIGYQVIKSGFAVLYRSIFDVVRDFLHDEALGQEDKVLSRYLKPDLLIIDDMGMKHLPKRSGEYLFEIVMRRHEVRSTMMTSNRPLEDWGKLVGDVPSASAILDRFLQHAEMIQITGRSYRLRDGGRDVKDEAGHSKPTSVPPSPDGSDIDSKPANAPPGSEKGRPGSKPANAPPGSEGSDIDSKPANAPPGSGRGRSSSKPASAPPGSEKGRGDSKPANAPPGSDESEEEEA
jgi:DNA replication protein DnaC